MASTSFKKKTYGRVKPVKVKRVKPAKPNVRELKRIYRGMAKEGIWVRVDMLCHAMRWWEAALVWMSASQSLTTEVSRLVDKSLGIRKFGLASTIEKEKAEYFVKSIRLMERATKAYFKAPSIDKVIKLSEERYKKVKKVKDSLHARYSKLLGLLAAMFRSCDLSIEIVPNLVDLHGGPTPRKFDHVLGVMRYSRDHAKSLQELVRKEGVLALAIQEGYWLARGMAFPKPKEAHGQFIANPMVWTNSYLQLMKDFKEWAAKDGPSKLVRKPNTKKKIKEEKQSEAVA